MAATDWKGNNLAVWFQTLNAQSKWAYVRLKGKAVPSMQLSKAKPEAAWYQATVTRRPLPPCQARKCALPNSEPWEEVRLCSFVWKKLAIYQWVTEGFLPPGTWTVSPINPPFYARKRRARVIVFSNGGISRSACVLISAFQFI